MADKKKNQIKWKSVKYHQVVLETTHGNITLNKCDDWLMELICFYCTKKTDNLENEKQYIKRQELRKKNTQQLTPKSQTEKSYNSFKASQFQQLDNLSIQPADTPRTVDYSLQNTFNHVNSDTNLLRSLQDSYINTEIKRTPSKQVNFIQQPILLDKQQSLDYVDINGNIQTMQLERQKITFSRKQIVTNSKIFIYQYYRQLKMMDTALFYKWICDVYENNLFTEQLKDLQQIVEEQYYDFENDYVNFQRTVFREMHTQKIRELADRIYSQFSRINTTYSYMLQIEEFNSIIFVTKESYDLIKAYLL